MNYQIKLTPTALNDLQNAIEFYNEQQKGLGKRFRTAAKRMFTQIKKFPKAGSFIYDEVRFRVLNKFPFIILYEIIDRKTIAVYRIFHTSLEPFWEKN